MGGLIINLQHTQEGTHLLVVVDDVGEIVELDGRLEAEHGLAVHGIPCSAVSRKLLSPLLHLPWLGRLRPRKLLQPHLERK